MIAWPLLATNFLFVDPKSAGVFLGLAVHDTSQVLGAAQSTGNAAIIQAATVTKLSRNLCLALALPALSVKSSLSLSSIRQHVPTFVLLFVGAR